MHGDLLLVSRDRPNPVGRQPDVDLFWRLVPTDRLVVAKALIDIGHGETPIVLQALHDSRKVLFCRSENIRGNGRCWDGDLAGDTRKTPSNPLFEVTRKERIVGFFASHRRRPPEDRLETKRTYIFSFKKYRTYLFLMQDPLEISICARLREERRRLGLTQEDLRGLCDTTVQTIRRWEKNTPIPCDQLARMTPSGVDGQYVVTGIRSTTGQTVAAGDAEISGTDQRLLSLVKTLTAEQRSALLAFLDTLSSGKPST